jgi:glycosyltransferase involved in cell wall biosynthesis
MFRPGKNQHELIELAAALPADLDWQLWLAGDGTTRAACEHTVAKHHLGSRVKFLGWQRDPSPLYVAADIAVHASRTESLSNFVIEAQAHGLPAVVYDAQGIGECFLPGETGFLLARGDRDGFRGAIERLARATPTEREVRAAQARAFAATAFNTQRHVREYLELLDRLAGARAHSAL